MDLKVVVDSAISKAEKEFRVIDYEEANIVVAPANKAV